MWAGDQLTGDFDLALARSQQPRDDLEQGGLATARGADDGHELAGLDAEVDAGERLSLDLPALKNLADARDLDCNAYCKALRGLTCLRR